MSNTLKKNITYLFVVQIANYLLPLITIPYISRTLGVDNYGWVEFAQTVSLYFLAIIDYSFDLTATRKLARIRDDKEQTKEYFNTIFFTKLLLFLAATALFMGLMLSVPKFQEYPLLMTVAFGVNLGLLLLPIWFFKGIEKLGIVALANFFIKLVFTGLIFWVVQSEDDMVWVPLSSLIGQILVALVTLRLAFRHMPGLKLHWPQWSLIQDALKEGFYVFGSSVANRVYSYGNVILLGFLVSETSLGLYSAANKLIVVAQTVLFAPLYGALFPHISSTVKKGMSFFSQQIKRAALLMGSINLVVVILFWLLTPFIIQMLFGAEYAGASDLLRIMVPLIYASGFINIFLYQGILNLDADKLFFKLVVAIGLLSLVLNYLLIINFDVEGAAYSRLIIEVLLALLAFFFYRNVKAKKLKHA